MVIPGCGKLILESYSQCSGYLGSHVGVVSSGIMPSVSRACGQSWGEVNGQYLSLKGVLRSGGRSLLSAYGQVSLGSPKVHSQSWGAHSQFRGLHEQPPTQESIGPRGQPVGLDRRQLLPWLLVTHSLLSGNPYFHILMVQGSVWDQLQEEAWP